MEASRDEGRKQKVLMGTCGWSDHTLLRCGRFYPASVRSAEDRLRHYGSHFPCVEVDTSTYAIPSKISVRRWLQAVPSGFVFHFKAFGLFCSKSCPFTAIPGDIRCKLSSIGGDDHVRLSSLPECIQDEVWMAFNSVLEPVYTAGSLGAVLFQFHLSFKPSQENRAHVLWCRRHLDPRFDMAVEFRSRDWFSVENFQATCEWLKENKLAFVAADELAHETFQKDREQTGLPEGQKQMLLPVAWAVTQPSFHYIRVHRREGSKRLLSPLELQTWVTRLQSKLPETLQEALYGTLYVETGFHGSCWEIDKREVKYSSQVTVQSPLVPNEGPIYFMWGTDWEDQPIVNARNLTQLLPEPMIFNWKAAQIATPTKGSLLSLFKTAQTSPLQIPCSSSSSSPVAKTSELLSHVSPVQNVSQDSNISEGDKYFESTTEKLGFPRKRVIESSMEFFEPIKKIIAFSPSPGKQAKPTPPKKKSTNSPTITSFFKPASSST